jgi:hypothetical protein
VWPNGSDLSSVSYSTRQGTRKAQPLVASRPSRKRPGHPAVRLVNETLDELKVEQHPDKTFVGRVSRGFEFLGYAITTPGIVGVAKKTLERFVERVTRLYEQGADSARIADYVRRWRVWVLSRLRAVACGGVGTNCHRSCRRRADSR